MYQYEYEHIKTSDWYFSTGSLQHRRIIADRAREGWRYVGWVPTECLGPGTIREVDLVFEREEMKLE